jgi:hypothetical protein
MACDWPELETIPSAVEWTTPLATLHTQWAAHEIFPPLIAPQRLHHSFTDFMLMGGRTWCEGISSAEYIAWPGVLPMFTSPSLVNNPFIATMIPIQRGFCWQLSTTFIRPLCRLMRNLVDATGPLEIAAFLRLRRVHAPAFRHVSLTHDVIIALSNGIEMSVNGQPSTLTAGQCLVTRPGDVIDENATTQPVCLLWARVRAHG